MTDDIAAVVARVRTILRRPDYWRSRQELHDLFTLCSWAERHMQAPADKAPWPDCPPDRHHWVNMRGGGQRCAACKITRGEVPAEPVSDPCRLPEPFGNSEQLPADLVETPADPALTLIMDTINAAAGDDTEGWFSAEWLAHRIFAALGSRIIPEGHVSVPADALRHVLDNITGSIDQPMLDALVRLGAEVDA